MTERKEWKLTAKMRMSQSDPHYIKIMLLYVLAAVLVPQVATSAVNGSMVDSMNQFADLIAGGIDPEIALGALNLSSIQVFSASALSIVLSIYQMVMGFGLTLYCLRLYRGEQSGPADLFTGFSMLGRVLGAQILVSLIMLACGFGLMIPVVGVITYAIIALPETAAIIISVVVYIACVVGLISIILNYVLTTLALADQPELGAMGAIQYSKNLIRGHKCQFLVLELSFLGWSLLCSVPAAVFGLISGAAALAAPELSIGLALSLPGWVTGLINVVLSLPVYLWLTPYMNTTIAGFYESLRDDGFMPQFPPMPPL